MKDLNGLLDTLDLVLAQAVDVTGSDAVSDLAESASGLRSRRGYMADGLVLALAGGTGSGKSSVLNAIAGEEVSTTSPLRPHTDAPLAWIPDRTDATLEELLDTAAIDDRVVQTKFPHLSIIDLPDHDSIVGTHREVVGRLLPLVDVVGWVVDPEKYRDRVLLEEYLIPLVDYQDQFFFILNQVDRVEAATEHIADDLLATLGAAGYDNPKVFRIAAAPSSGPPQGLGPLLDHLGHELDAKRLVLRRVLTDVARLNRTVAARSGLSSVQPLGFDDRWAEVAGSIAASGGGDFEDRLCQLEDFVGAIAVETGGPTGDRVRRLLPPQLLEKELRRALELQDPDAVRGRLDEVIGSPLRVVLWARSRLAATIALLAVDVAESEHRWQREGREADG